MHCACIVAVTRMPLPPLSTFHAILFLQAISTEFTHGRKSMQLTGHSAGAAESRTNQACHHQQPTPPPPPPVRIIRFFSFGLQARTEHLSPRDGKGFIALRLVCCAAIDSAAVCSAGHCMPQCCVCCCLLTGVIRCEILWDCPFCRTGSSITIQKSVSAGFELRLRWLTPSARASFEKCRFSVNFSVAMIFVRSIVVGNVFSLFCNSGDLARTCC